MNPDAEFPKSLKKLKSLNKKGPLAFEVEHLLALVRECGPQHLASLQALLSYPDWKTCEDVEAELARSSHRFVPLASWRRLVLGCIASGPKWVADQALQRDLESKLAVAVLAATCRQDTAIYLLDILQVCARDDRRDGEVLQHCVEELNLWGLPPKGKGSTSPALGLTDQLRNAAREQLEDLACSCKNHLTRTHAVYALRWFGDSSTPNRLANADELPEPFRGAKAEVIRFIRKATQVKPET